MAAEIEDILMEDTEIVKSSGGVFEVEDRGALIFSKKQLKRFPGEEEIFEIISSVEKGIPLEEAKLLASKNIPEPPSFFEWLQGLLRGKKTT